MAHQECRSSDNSLSQLIVPKALLDTGHNATVVDAIIISSLRHDAHTWRNMVQTNWYDLAKSLALAYANAVPSFGARIDHVHYRYIDKYISTSVKRHNVQHQVRRKRLLFLPGLLN